MRKLPISLCLIVKNEQKYLDACLKSCKDFVSEMVVVDTGSTDDTVDIALRNDAKVFHYTWENDFAKARNVSISHATYPWILQLDADEEIFSEDVSWFYDTYPWPQVDGYRLFIHNLASEEKDSDDVFMIHPLIRFYRNHPQIKYRFAIHENIMIPTGRITNGDARILHQGYANADWNKIKSGRNFDILMSDLRKDPYNPLTHYYLAQCYLGISDRPKAFAAARKSLQYGATFPIKSHVLRICLSHCIDHSDFPKFREMLAVTPSKDVFPEREYFLGVMEHKLGNFEKALEHYDWLIDEALEYDERGDLGKEDGILITTLQSALINAKNLFLISKDYQKAAEYLEKGIETKAYSLSLRVALIKLYIMQQIWPKAMENVDLLLDEVNDLPDEETVKNLQTRFGNMKTKIAELSAA